MRAVLAVLWLVAAGCASPAATIDEHSTINWWSEEPVAERVSEDGLTLKLALGLHHLKDREVSILVYDGKGCAAEKNVTPAFEDTRFDDLSVWIPWSRLCAAAKDLSLTVYVASPDDPETHLATRTLHFELGDQPRTWCFRCLGFEDAVEGGVPGWKGKLYLDARHVEWERAQVVVLVGDEAGREIPPGSGGPLRVLSSRLQRRPESAGRDVYWDDLDFFVPHSIVAGLDPARPLTLTPALEVVGRGAARGNVHFHVWAGGPSSRVENRLRDECSRLDEDIRSTEERLKALEEAK